MLKMWLCCVQFAVACDWTLFSQPTPLNIWEFLALLDLQPSPFVLCLNKSDDTHLFILDDTPEGCVWPSPDLIIQYLPLRSACSSDFCERQTLWLQGRNSCIVNNRLTFVNVTLSGRRHFTPDCASEDWCTHCLDVSMLMVSDEGSYQTIIDHHEVNPSDPAYQEWQAKCGAFVHQHVFMVSPGAELSFEGCDLLDIRFRPSSFVCLTASTLVLTNTTIQRMDAEVGFIFAEASTNSTLIMHSCYVTGFNRDHAIDTGKSSRFINTSGSHLKLTISSSVFEDNIISESSLSMLVDAYIYLETDYFDITDSTFLRGKGGIMLALVGPSSFGHISNATFQAMFSYFSILLIASESSNSITLTNCRFIDNHSRYPTLFSFANINQNMMLYRNNRITGGYLASICYLDGPTQGVLNSVFENNGAYDSTVEAFWADYYLSKGLLNDDGLTAEKNELLQTSRCTTALFIRSICPQITNVTLTDNRVTPCTSSLSLNYLSPDDQGCLATIENLWISTQASIALNGVVMEPTGTLYLTNSVLEYGERLLVLEGKQAFLSLLASNVTFQCAKGTISLTAPVSLFGISGIFKECQWKHNRGKDSGALAVYLGSLEVQSSVFLNNSCISSAGDLLLAADKGVGVALYINDSSFISSQSVVGAACIQVTGNLSLGAEVSNSTFQYSFSLSSALLVLAHHSGHFFLTNLKMLDINAQSASLVIVMTPTSTSWNLVETTVEQLEVFNCTFSKGLVLLAESGSPSVTIHSNHFEGNNGSAVWVNAGNVSDWGSEYRTNVGDFPLYYQKAGTGLLHSVRFEGNYPSQTLGMIYIEGSSAIISLFNCTFRSNSDPKATALLILQQGKAALANCLFESNRVLGAVILAKFLSFTLENSFFTNHSSVLQLESTSAFVTSSTFSEVRSFSILAQSDLEMQNTTVRELVGTNDCLVSGTSSKVSFVDMTLERIKCNSGILTMLTGSRLLIDRTLMRYVESGTSVLMINSGDAVLTNVKLLHAEGAEQLILLLNTTVIMRETTISDSLSSLIRATETHVTLDSCHFAHIHTSQNVGVLTCTACRNLTVSGCTFEKISAGSVAGLYAETAAFQVINSIFQLLEARDTGALRIDAVLALVSSCWFFNNTASYFDSSGGALRLNATSALINTSLFHYNSAASGGAVYLVSGAATWQSNSFQNNTANYGPDFASYPSHLQADQDRIYLNSGYVVQSAFIVRLLDNFNQLVSTDNYTEAWLDSNLSMNGNLKVRAVTGLFIFSSFSVTAPPGSSSRLTIATSLLRIPLTLVFRSCDTGEIETKSMCLRCAPSTYSLNPNATECQLCPKHAQCPGGSQLYPDSGYWRSDPQSEEVFQCPRADACLGHANFSSEVGYCAVHYTGNLCQSCATGMGRHGRDGCIPCESDLRQKARAVGLGTGLAGLWLFLSVIQRSDGQTALLRIAVDYLQFMVLLADFDFNWPVSLQGFYHLHRYLGSAAQHFLLMDCLTSNAFFANTLVAASAPLVSMLLFAFLWTIIWLICVILKLSFPYLNKYASLMMVSFTYLHCFILRTVLAAFHCIAIQPGESWLRADMTVRCWNKSHLTITLAIALPATLLWGVGVPAILLLLLIRRHRYANTMLALPVYLSAGFKNHLYFWELAIVCFKTGVVVLYVSMANWSPSLQALTLFLLLSAATVLQSKVSPLKTLAISRIQWVSFTTVLVTAYSGVYFSMGAQSSVLVAFVLLVHSCFAMLWGFTFFRAILKKCFH